MLTGSLGCFCANIKGSWKTSEWTCETMESRVCIGRPPTLRLRPSPSPIIGHVRQNARTPSRPETTLPARLAHARLVQNSSPLLRLYYLNLRPLSRASSFFTSSGQALNLVFHISTQYSQWESTWRTGCAAFPISILCASLPRINRLFDCLTISARVLPRF
jgi:hypothetical protein